MSSPTIVASFSGVAALMIYTGFPSALAVQTFFGTVGPASRFGSDRMTAAAAATIVCVERKFCCSMYVALAGYSSLNWLKGRLADPRKL
jgi:hypothetical protein